MAKRSRKKDESLLKEIRDRYAAWQKSWKDIRDEGATDMRYVSGQPWSEKDLKQREDAGRPALVLDEITQYTNQCINNVRENKRAIQINPAGNGATSKSAEFWQSLIRGIEYKSNAQQNSYIPAFENMVNRSYGFFRVTRRYVGKTFNQEIVLKGIPNPDSVTFDPNVKEADWSDAEGVFIADPVRKSDFKMEHPGAEVTDFTAEDVKLAPDWITDEYVIVSEYWKVRKVKRNLVLLIGADGKMYPSFEDELDKLPKQNYRAAKDADGKAREREYEDKEITQYITNGLEILDEIEQPGTIIPIIPVIGKELFVPEGGKVKRKLISLVRMARDPYMLYCYLASQMAEEAAQTPKSPFLGYKGQFESDADAWKSVTKIPHATLQVDIVVDGAGSPLPLPARPQFVPNFGEYIQSMEFCKRSVQAAFGINPLPTAAQKQNEKSGVALEKIATQEAIGSFHFTDNFDRALNVAGRVIMEWGPVTYNSTDQEVALIKGDDSQELAKMNTAEPYMDAKGQPVHYPYGQDEESGSAGHDVTISTGPSYASQRDEAAALGDKLLEVIEQLPIDPVAKGKFVALIIRMRNVGELGNEMADILDPSNDPAKQQQQNAQTQQQLGQAQQLLTEVQGELQKLQLEKAGRVIDNQFKMQIEKLHAETTITVAEINTKAQNVMQRLEMFLDMQKELHGSAHDAAMQGAQQQHEQGMAQQAQAAAAQQQQVEQAAPEPQSQQ